MIVKGTKQLGSFRRGINLYIPKKVQSTPEQVIWKVAIFGADTASSNGEYVWDGLLTQNFKPVYSGNNNQIYWDEAFGWVVYDGTLAAETYNSSDLVTWDVIVEGSYPAPSSALSYSQSSFISSVTISFPDLSLVDGVYSRTSGGTTSLFDSGNYNYMYQTDGVWYLWSEDAADSVALSLDLVKWEAQAGFADPVNATAISYSA